MKPRDIRVFLYDAKLACDRILRFTAGHTLEEYVGDELLRSAVERQFTVLGEALARARALDRGLEQRIADLSQIVAFRNRLIHNYEAIDPHVVWAIVQTGVPTVRSSLDQSAR
jgi:uncharacterized protein with HEPN domain